MRILLFLLTIPLFSQGIPFNANGMVHSQTVAALIGPVDAYIDLSSTTNGTTLTTAILNNASSTHGIGNTGNWVITGTAPVALTHQSACTLGGSVQALGTIFATSNASLAWTSDNSATSNHIDLSAPVAIDNAFTKVSALVCFIPGVTTFGGSGVMDIFRVVGNHGHLGLFQISSSLCGSVNGFDVEATDTIGAFMSSCSTSTYTVGTAVWLSILVDFSAGTVTGKIYDSSFTLQATLSITGKTFTAGESISSIQLGNAQTGTGGATTNKFENFMIRWSGAPPSTLGPTNTTQDPVYWVTQSHNNKTSAGTTVATTLALEEHAGDAVVVTCSNENASGQTTGVTNTAGETFTSAGSCKSAANAQSISQWVTFPSSGHTAQLYTCTFPSSSFSNVDAQIIHGATAFDTCAVGNKSSGADIVSGSFTPSTSTGTNIVGAYIQAGVNLTVGTNYSLMQSNSTNSFGAELRTNAPNSSQTAGMVHANTSASMLVVGNYKQ